MTRAAWAALAVLTLVGAGATLLAGANPFDAAAALLRGAVGGPQQLEETLVQTASLLFPALAVAFALRAGLFNIGADGQAVAGGLAAGLIGAGWPGAGPLALVAALAGGTLAGGLWGALAGGLRARFGGSEVIATLMLNVLAGLLATYLLSGPLRAPGATGPETAGLPESAWLPLLVSGTRLSAALPIALVLALALQFVLARTLYGFELRAAGSAPEVARRAGIDLGAIAFSALTLSGAIAGLGGATIVTGVLHRFDPALSPGYGFIGIAVALVGGLAPLRIVLSAFGFAVLQSGSLTMQAFAHVPKDVVVLLEGLAIVALGGGRALVARKPLLP
jgi:simple sugar transport system permease protein